MITDNGTAPDLTPQQMAAEIEAVKQSWIARRYSLSLQARVAKRLDEPYDHLKTEMERCEKWLDALDAELAALVDKQIAEVKAE